MSVAVDCGALCYVAAGILLTATMTTSNQRESQRLFDYFAIIGLSPDGGLEPDRLQGKAIDFVLRPRSCPQNTAIY